MLENPMFWFSLISTCLSLYAAYNTWTGRHAKLSISYNWCYKAGDQINISFNLINKSTQNVSIDKISFVNHGKTYPCSREPVILLSREKEKAFSSPLPLNISSNASLDFIGAFQYLEPNMSLHEYTFIFSINGANTTVNLDLSKHTLTTEQFVERFESKL